MIFKIDNKLLTTFLFLLCLTHVDTVAADQGAAKPGVDELCSVSLPADDLGRTLIEFAEQCTVPVVVPFDRIRGVRSSPVVGPMPIADAIDRLLKSTPFTYRVIPATQQVEIVLRQPTPSTEAQLGESAEVQSTEGLEEIVVTGLRQSLIQSAQIKRLNLGFVDAITAEDIGKFPDSNIAESIQRIPGATISRDNGEGSQVTIRGFSGNYNLVTLNGRLLPMIAAPVDRIEDSRAFEFSNLAADNIAAVVIHKTSQADSLDGSIGALIDVATYRPLEVDDDRNYLAVKTLHDPSTQEGRSLTPELAGMVTLTNRDKTLGVTLSGVFEQRDSGSARAYVSGWDTQVWAGDRESLGAHGADCAQSGGDIGSDPCSTLVNEPALGQLFSLPQDLAYAVFDTEQSRLNTQLTVQYRPLPKVTLSLDYAMFRKRTEHHVSQASLRFTDNRNWVEFDDRAIRTPIRFSETIFNGNGQTSASDLGFAAQRHQQENRTDLIGFNADWSLSDTWKFSLDAHRASTRSGPRGEDWGSWTNVRFGANVVGAQSVDWSSDLPTASIVIDDQRLAPYGTADGQFDAGDIGSQVAYTNYSFQRVEVEQLQLESQWQTDPITVKAGLDYHRSINTTRFSEAYFIMGDWGIQDPDQLPDEYFRELDFASHFDDVEQNAFVLPGFATDAERLARWGERQYPESFPNGLRYNRDFAEDRRLQENSMALYGLVNARMGMAHTHLELGFGLRYVNTEVTSGANVNVPEAVVWLDNGDFETLYQGLRLYQQQRHQYHQLLPSLAAKWDLSDGWLLRLGFGQSMARAEYGQMSPEVASFQINGITEAGRNNAFASAGNPRLEPIKSTNFDLALEWYWQSSSYFSVGYYLKDIDNFIGFGTVSQSAYDLRDASNGARADQARDDIAARPEYDGTLSDTELFNQIAANENNDFSELGNDNTYYGDTYDIYPNDQDRLYTFVVTQPDNNKRAQIWGMEYAAQIFFGESGFGFLINYTSVNGDVGFDITTPPSGSQYALLGLSDAMNAVAIYDKAAFQARLAYNWRDTYLKSLDIEPEFVESFHQLDFMTSYAFNESLSCSFEAINITGENSREHGRTAAQLVSLTQLEPRYTVGLRYQF